jgi:hypothetical protein
MMAGVSKRLRVLFADDCGATLAAVTLMLTLAPGSAAAQSSETAAPSSDARTRGVVLPLLYVSLAGLNGWDAYSTSVGLAHGAHETNRMMAGVSTSEPALWAVKAGSTGVSIAIAERLWRRQRRRDAIVVMLLTNTMMTAVAARNADIVRHLSRTSAGTRPPNAGR